MDEETEEYNLWQQTPDPLALEENDIVINNFSYVKVNSSEHQRTYIARDETESVRTGGGTNKPLHNLGYLESTDDFPARYEVSNGNIETAHFLINLTTQTGDIVVFDPDMIGEKSHIEVVEEYNNKNNPSWSTKIKQIDTFTNTSGGALPSTIERVAAYTPLVSIGFDGNLTPEVNNLQALAQAVDDLVIVGEAVVSVTGDGVDNTDPDNPVLSFPDAGDVAVTDAGNYFTGTDVEAVLQELGLDGRSFATTATAGGTTTLTAASATIQVFTGTLTETVNLPDTSALFKSWTVRIINTSTQAIVVKTSSGATLATIGSNTDSVFNCLSITSNFVTAWNWSRVSEYIINLSDITTGNANTTNHGFAPKAVAPAAGQVNVLGIENGETHREDKALFSDDDPEANGTADPGTSILASRSDHVHAGGGGPSLGLIYFLRG